MLLASPDPTQVGTFRNSGIVSSDLFGQRFMVPYSSGNFPLSLSQILGMRPSMSKPAEGHFS